MIIYEKVKGLDISRMYTFSELRFRNSYENYRSNIKQ